MLANSSSYVGRYPPDRAPAGHTGVMKEQRIIRSRILNQPMHRPQNILLRRLAHRVLQIVRQDYHVLALIPKVLKQVRRHVLDVVDATP